MKKLFSILSTALLCATTIPTANAGVRLSVDFFHENLESYGDWREVGNYGYVWQPRDVPSNWRPYSDGRWLYTDAGWTWDSDEPYSWAVYHYGRWARVERIGWVWVPGTEWGPAWVSWRSSHQHVGWAPLPPEAHFRRSVGFSFRVDEDYNIGPMSYNFVDVRNFGSRRLQTVIVEPRDNIRVINQTTNITQINYGDHNTIYNAGPRYETISRESAEPIQRLKLERRSALEGNPTTVRAEQMKSQQTGDSLRVVALPFVEQKRPTAPRKVVEKVQTAVVDHGWKDAGSAEDVEKLRGKIKTEANLPHSKKGTLIEKLPPRGEAPVSTDEKPTVVKEPAKKTDKPSASKKPKATEPIEPPVPQPAKIAPPDTEPPKAAPKAAPKKVAPQKDDAPKKVAPKKDEAPKADPPRKAPEPKAKPKPAPERPAAQVPERKIPKFEEPKTPQKKIAPRAPAPQENPVTQPPVPEKEKGKDSKKAKAKRDAEIQ